MEIEYFKYSPTQNTTILVVSDVPVERHAEIAARLMAEDSVCAEQTGFILPPKAGSDGALRMMGGEFCGNATMSLGAYIAGQKDLPVGSTAVYRLDISGAEKPVECSITRKGEYDFYGEVDMPLPIGIEEVEIGDRRFPLVRFDGIAHIIAAGADLDRDRIRKALPGICAAYHADACGALFLTDESFRQMEPLVYVPSTGTFVREHGCGSGTAAIGAYLSQCRNSGIVQAVAQPGGTMFVRTHQTQNGTTGIVIGGTVTLCCRGTAYINV